MSFSSEVKEELSRHLPTARHCQIAETAAILSLCGQISEKDGTIRIQTENAYVARKYFTLLKKTFNIEAELAVKLNQKENTYLIRVNDREETCQILQAVKLHETDRQLAMPIPAVVVQRQCCKRAFLRGAFLASGSISDPNRFYHLEIVCPDAPRAEQVQELLKSFGIDARIVLRKNHHVVYMKEGAQIVEMLGIMEANIALMNLENVRILKEMRTVKLPTSTKRSARRSARSKISGISKKPQAFLLCRNRWSRWQGSAYNTRKHRFWNWARC